MIKKRIKIFVVFMAVCFFVNTSFADSVSDRAKSCSSLFEGNDLIPHFDISVSTQKEKTLKNLTKNFCENVHGLKCVDDGDYFDLSQSIFLSILCNTVMSDQDNTYTDEIQESLKKKNFFDFAIISQTGYHEDCHPYGGMRYCNYSYHLPYIFNMILSDFFDIRQSTFYGINGLSDDFSKEDAANLFASQHFPMLDSVEGDSNEHKICDGNNTYYKKTCDKLKSYMQQARNLLVNTKIIDIQKMQEKADSDGVDCENDFGNNLLYCGLLGDPDLLQKLFTNAVYNEYMSYKLFLSYYSFYLNGSDYSASKSSDLSDKIEENLDTRLLIQQQLDQSKQAISVSFRALSEISNSFPLHIGFSLYQEDAQLFMKNIAKLYSPLRTLYDKLQNVQIKTQ